MKPVSSPAAPSEGAWTSTSACISVSGFACKGGMFGFCANGYGYIDNLTIKSWNSGTSAFDVTEVVEDFTTNGSGYVEETIDYDRNGNLIYDGLQKYTYDAWNRLTGIAHAYRSSGTMYAGQTAVTMKYDGKGRRIQKAVANTGNLDCTFKYFYDGDSNIETRNGSDMTIKEMVWGTNYIDELVSIKSWDSDLDDLTPARYVCQDANYNVLGIVNDSGALIERYEYTPYGQRKVFFSAGSNDGKCYAPTLASRRTSAYDAWGECEFGHQGLMHDEEIELVYNRARHLHPGLGRFIQRDPLVYDDGLSLYAYLKSAAIARLDPNGKLSFGVYGNYCGAAGNAITYPPNPAPIDAVDAACYWHDVCYGAAGASGLTDPNSNCTRECDRKLFNAIVLLLDHPEKLSSLALQAANNTAGFFRASCNAQSEWEKCHCKPLKTDCLKR